VLAAIKLLTELTALYNKKKFRKDKRKPDYMREMKIMRTVPVFSQLVGELMEVGQMLILYNQCPKL
jgi:hypothetical protein